MSRAAWSRLAVVVGVLGVVAGAHALGVFDLLRDPQELRASLVGLGPWGYLAFVVAYTALQPFGVPGTVFVMAAPLIWPWPVAFALSMVGTMGASVVGFSFARFIARDWVAARIPQRFRRYDEALGRRAFATVFFLRFVFWMPQLLHSFLGVSRVPFWTHFWASALGYAVPLLVVSYFGQKAFDALRHASPSTWLAVGGAVVAIAVIAFVTRRWRSASPA